MSDETEEVKSKTIPKENFPMVKVERDYPNYEIKIGVLGKLLSCASSGNGVTIKTATGTVHVHIVEPSEE